MTSIHKDWRRQKEAILDKHVWLRTLETWKCWLTEKIDVKEETPKNLIIRYIKTEPRRR